MATGFCKICSSSAAPRLNKLAEQDIAAPAAIEAAAKMGLKFTRQTWYRHLEHIKPKQIRMKELLEEAAEVGGLEIKQTTNVEFLETIRDIGYSQITANPDIVKPDLALKAVQILEGRKEKTGDQLNILINVLTGHAPPLMIQAAPDVEGTFRELPEGETE